MLVEHHIKYKEIHGTDEVKTMTVSEHRRLHIRLRKEGKCNIPSNKLHEISGKARTRTMKYKQTQTDYKKKSRVNLETYIKLEKYIFLMERFVYNKLTDSFFVVSGFRSQKGHVLPIICEGWMKKGVQY